MQGLIDRFRRHNRDVLEVKICLLNEFSADGDETLKYLIAQLGKRQINIDLAFSESAIEQLNIQVINKSRGSIKNLSYPLANMVELISLAGCIETSLLTVLIMKATARIINDIRIMFKGLVLDLDETLWPGVLAETGNTKIIEGLKSDRAKSFIRFMRFVAGISKELGIFVALCTRNDAKQISDVIEELETSYFPIKGQIDLIAANYNDKSENIRQIASGLQIRADALVFVDDNEIIRQEVKDHLPEVLVLDWQTHEELTAQIQAGCLFDRQELSCTAKNRKATLKYLNAARAKNYPAAFKR